MKKIILISTLLHLTFTLLAKDETNSAGIGKYVVKFYTTYTERHSNVLTSTIINSSLCLNSDMNSTSCNAEDYDDTARRGALPTRDAEESVERQEQKKRAEKRARTRVLRLKEKSLIKSLL